MKDTKGQDYRNLLASKEYKPWKRILDVQKPYRWNLKRLDLGAVLDVGCGIGRNLMNLTKNGNSCIGIDHNEFSIEESIKRGFEAYTVESFKARFQAGDKKFDSILVAHVLEHTGTELAISLLQEYLPYLKPGGQVVLITPQEKGFTMDPTHIEFMDLDKLREILQAVGLEVKDAYNFPFPRLIGRLFAYNEFVALGVKT